LHPAMDGQFESANSCIDGWLYYYNQAKHERHSWSVI